MKEIQFVIPDTLASFEVDGKRVTIPMQDWLKKALTTISHWSEFLTFSSFGIKDNEIPISKLDIGEIHFPLCLPAQNFTTTKTAGDNIGAYFHWNPAAFPSGKWYLEASIAISNANGTATLTLKGATDVKTLTTSEIGMTNKREQVTMPTSGQTLYLNLKSSSSSYTAALGGARLILVP